MMVNKDNRFFHVTQKKNLESILLKIRDSLQSPDIDKKVSDDKYA